MYIKRQSSPGKSTPTRYPIPDNHPQRQTIQLAFCEVRRVYVYINNQNQRDHWFKNKQSRGVQEKACGGGKDGERCNYAKKKTPLQRF